MDTVGGGVRRTRLPTHSPSRYGSPSETTIARLRPDLSAEERSAAAARLLDLECDDLTDVVPAPGAIELIGTLERLGLPWAVFTSASNRLAKVRLGAAGISPSILVTVDDVTHGKPDPEGYLRAAELLGVPPRHCLVVEDTEVGLSAGRAAGAVTAGLKGTPRRHRAARPAPPGRHCSPT